MFVIRYRHNGRIWCTVDSAPDAAAAAARFKSQNPHVEFVSCSQNPKRTGREA
jgi:hypothetical protein